MRANEEEAMRRYEALLEELEAERRRLMSHPGYVGCRENCDTCCRGTSLLSILPVEMIHMKQGLLKLPPELREYIYDRARRAILKALSLGYDAGKLMEGKAGEAMMKMRGGEAVCPFLIGGVCAIYDQRPLICRIWGLPMFDGLRTSCCKYTFVGNLDALKPIDYTYFRREAIRIGEESGCGRGSIPMSYAILIIKAEEEVEREGA